MKNIHYYFIIAILSLIIGLLNIDIQSSKDIYDVRLDEGYMSSSKTLSSNTSIGNNLPMNSVFPTNSKPVGTPINVHPVLKQDEYMSAAFEYSLGDARLIGEAGCMREDVALSINPIESNQLPPLNQGMVNVTGDNTGYRMLPKGMVFKNDIDIILPYDTTLLPIGFTPNDIKTYYYDERFKRWIEIERDSVDEANHLVISKVNHFTDFINAILKTPEMPETSAYAPTQMNDIKAANPLEGLTLMQPPTANNSGTISMSYPIEIPAGRQGMQPNLSLNYNGGTSSSWVGVGWDISMPTISVETRWGVPRYDHSKESEVYLLDGQQLVTQDENGGIDAMPHRTNIWKNRNISQTEKQFFPRINDSHDSIVRHGNCPTNYWWSVTDRNGKTSYYGKMHNSDTINPNAVLSDDSSNIAQWNLTETRDINGNTVRYFYSIIKREGYENSDIKGKTIYIDSINYTGFVDSNNVYENGKYTVGFQRSEESWEDASVSCNYGFKQVVDDKLCQVYVTYQDTFVRGIRLRYEKSSKSLYKTRLIDIVSTTGGGFCKCHDEGDADTSTNMILRTHLDYFDKPTNVFGKYDTIMGYDDHITSFFITNPSTLMGVGSATGLGATRGKSWSAGGTGTVGLGPIVVLSSASVGGNFDYNRSQNEGALTLIDLDGDGLADKVFKENNKVFFKKHRVLSNGKHTFDSPKIELVGLKDFQCDVSSNTGWGLQASAVVGYSGSWPTNTSTTNTYFSDVNADGLTDLITDEGVLFNTLVNGVPTFKNFIKEQYQDTSNTNPDQIITSAFEPCGSTIFDGYVNNDIACDVDLILDTIIKDSYFHYPYDTLIARYSDSTEYFMIFEDYFGSDFIAKIYRKVIHCEPISLDPDIDAVRTWVAPKSGMIRIISNFKLLNDTTVSYAQSRFKNGVRYAIELCDEIGDYNTYMPNNNYNLMPPNQNILLKSMNVPEYDTIPKIDTLDLYVSGNSILFFRLQSKKNRDFDKAFWIQDIQYLDNLSSNPIDDHYNSNNDYLVTGQDYFVAPTDGYVQYDIDVNTGYLYGKTVQLIVEVNNTVLRIDTLVNSSHIVYSNSKPVDSLDCIKFLIKGDIPKNHPIWSNIQAKTTIKYDSYSPSITERVVYNPSVNYFQVNQINANILDTVFFGLFGPMYRGWGQFGYNNNYENADTSDVINVSELKRQLSYISSANQLNQNAINSTPCTTCNESNDMVESFESNGMYNPLSLSTRWVEMNPNNFIQSWIGYGNITYISKEMMSNTRIYELYTAPETQDIPSYDSPIPISNSTSYGPKTIRKVNETYSKNHSVNASLGVSIGGSSSNSENKIITDYMDLNGDRYPDIIGPVYVQYSKPWGGIDPNTTQLNAELQINTLSLSSSNGLTFGGSYPVAVRMPSNDPKKAKMTISGKGSPGGNGSTNSDQTAVSWMDVNGDGLPDKVSKDGTVALNLGYKFLNFDSLNIPTIRNGSSESVGANYGLNFDVSQASISGGIGVSISQNHTEKMLMDFNGDGLPDYVYRENGNLKVQYNLGNGTYSPVDIIDTIKNISHGISSSESLNASINFGFTLFGFKIGIGISAAPYNKTFSKDKVQWVDINGDGYVDYVTSEDEDEIYVRYNQTGKTNLLRKVTNFTGSYFELNYDSTALCYESPQKSWVLKSVLTNDPYSPIGGRTSYTTYEYKNPKYNRFERIAFGYDTVITNQINPIDGSVYRKTIQGFNNKSFIKKGKKKSETVCDANNHVYTEAFYEVEIFDDNGNLIGDSECPDISFPNRECEVTNYYEGQSTPQITTKKCVVYDNYKNVTEYYNEVDSANSILNDNLKAIITYKTNMPNNLISLVDTMIVTDYSNNEIRKKTAEYNSFGKLFKINQYNGTNVATIDLEYDQYGNINKIIYPENINSQRMWYQYVYDPVLHSFPITVTSALGFQSSTQYDYKWGNPTRTFDINGQEMRYKYDNRGRLLEILGPNEIANNAPYTLKMEYYPVNYHRWNIFSPTQDTFSYAVTSHYDVQNPSNPMKTTLLCDGLGRVIQTKKDIVIDGVEKSSVSGKIILDPFGRTIKQYHPVTEALTSYNRYNYSYDTTTATVTQFDVLDREISITLPTTDITQMEYTFGNDAFGNKRFLTISTDPNGNKVKTYTDPRKLQTTLIADSTIVTTFEYSAMGELLQSTDPEGHITSYSYNNFGQKISRIHPDAGTDNFKYDLSGNLISRQTQDLINSSMDINYEYNYNQMIAIHYPKNPENDVYYYYGDNNASNNCKGRVYAIEDASGRQEFVYGNMGEVVGNTRTFALPNESNTYTFAMKFEYDSWNRILGTTYPDGEYVRYWYNNGGQLMKMASDYNNVAYNYIDSIIYNKFEKRTKICYGNGTRAEYNYDVLQRLVNLKSTSSSGIMQKIEYTFDHVNNIQSINNVAPMLSNGLGGTYNHNYSYDNIYRLTSSDGIWENNNNTLNYSLNMSYTDDGKIRTKYQSAGTLINGGLSNFAYENDYNYTTSQSHTVNSVYDNLSMTYQDFVWDANGNLINYRAQYPDEIKRKLCWDEENRLMAVGDNKYTSYYVYDNGGERTYKLTGTNTLMNVNGNWMNIAYLDNPTLYTSAYLVANLQGYSKHYYAGSERIASSIGLGGLEVISNPLELTGYHNSWEDKSASLNEEMTRTINECIGNEIYSKKTLENLYDLIPVTNGTMDRYFYHPDHLGSSSWITDASGQAIQHLHYLPFGEDWIDQRNTSWNAPYTFSGKEKDVETGYGYFGARYYDSGLSIWLSVDPMSDKYPSMSPYNYCANNPVILVDPDGRDIWEINPEGRVVWKEKSEKHTLYAVDDAGKRTGKSLTLKNRAIFDGLASTGKESNYSNSHAVGGENSQDDMLQTFKFVADNSKVEWRIDRFSENDESNYSIGTIHNRRLSPGADQMGHSARSVIAFIHSHPNSNSKFRNMMSSMGWSIVNNGYYDNDNDVNYKTNQFAYRNTLYYTYFPKSGDLYNVRSGQIPAFIKNINNYKDFMFGTINTK